ncbi:MAG: hypothetical protein ACRDRX_01490 [Pseudonocardiaceae bacterium]
MTVHTAGDHGNVYQAGYHRLRDVLHSAVTHTGSDARDGVESLAWRTGVALDSLLAAHPVDRRGRCRSCRRPRFWRRRRACMVFQQAHYWLRQPADQLAGRPVVSSSLPPRSVPGAGRPDLDHGGAGVPTPGCSWPRRDPPAGPLLLTGGPGGPR